MSRLFSTHRQARLTVAGCGCDERDVLADFADADRHRVTVIRNVEGNDQLGQIYLAHDVFVLPSFFEGQPLSMLEAASQGLAIVTTNVCGMRDSIVDDQNGILVSPGDVVALGEALLRLAARPDEVLRLGNAARKSVQRYTWDAVARDMLRAYESAVCARRQPSRAGSAR